MATVQGSQLKLNDGRMVTPQTGGWYDGQQYWNGSLSNPGQINSQSNQPGAGTQVSNEVIAQTNPNNVGYIEQRKKETAAKPQAQSGGLPTAGNAQMPGVGQLAGAGTGVQMPAAPTIDLPKLYESLYANSGIKTKQDELAEMNRRFTEVQGQINDNPFLSEATRVGRIAKADELYQNRTKNTRDEIATVKADIETQLNLQTKQFDINSQAAKDALNQFNALLEMGALDNASGEDIANITRATGLSSGAIQGAIENSRQSGLQTSIQSFDDGDEEGFVVLTIDQGGNIVNSQRQVTGVSGKKRTFDTTTFLTTEGNNTNVNSGGGDEISGLWNA